MPIKSFTKTIAAAADPETLTGSDLICVWANIQANPSNGGSVYGPKEDNTVAAGNAAELQQGDVFPLPPVGAMKRYNLAKLWFKAAVNGLKLNVTYDDGL